MKKYFLFLMMLIILSTSNVVPQVADVNKRPLKDVLTDIESRYGIKLQYSENLVKGLEVEYPVWRYRVDTKQTLNNILLPLNLVYEKTGDGIYRISRFNYYQRPVEEGRKHLEQLLSVYPDLSLWEKRKAMLRKCFLEQLGLSPFPRSTPFNPIITKVRKYDGYTVENIAIETIPGVFLTGSLYKPAKVKGPFPLILCPYGHFSNADTNLYGRYRPDMQYRCATLARMGAAVFSYDMFAWGESRLQFPSEAHRTLLAHTMQTLNTIRAIDYFASLSFIDEGRIGITGASGGATQAFLAAALDDRISVSVPVVMVSSYYYGGCPCESGMPIQSCGNPPTYNAEIAAMASPRPMLVVSDGADWTSHVPEIEYPYLKKVYELYGKESLVKNVHLPDEVHDYGINKRIPMYEFMAKHLGLNLNIVKDKSGSIDESKVTVEKYHLLLVFGREGKMPASAVRKPEDVFGIISSLK